MFDIHRVELDWGGRKLVLETGKMARQADGAVVASYGESKVLANPADAHAVNVFDTSIRGSSDRFALRFRKPRR